MNLDHALRELARQMMHRDVFPSCLPNHWDETDTDLAKPLAVAKEQVAGLLRSMTEDEIRAMAANMTWFWGHRVGPEAVHQGDPAAIDICVKGYIVDQVRQTFDPLEDALRPAADQADEVGKAFPELSGQFDEDGLLHLGPGLEPTSGAVFYGDWALQYSQFLRRHYTSRPNQEFLCRLSEAADPPSRLGVRVAIDRRRVMRGEDYRMFREADYWYGPKFSIEKLDDPRAAGRTVHSRSPEPDPGLDLEFPLMRTEFLLYMQDGRRAIEFEELVPEQEQPRGVVVNRYIHALRDAERHVFTHLDGAARWYRKGDYPGRLDTDIAQGRRLSCGYIKLFRVDGDIPDGTWADLVCYFYRGNELVREYLSGTQAPESSSA